MANMMASASLIMAHDGDPKEKLIKAVGKRADGMRPLWAQVLIGVYQRMGYEGKEGRTAGGVIIPGKVNDEDQFQGKIGLLLAIGPGAFRDSEGNLFPEAPRVHDWVHFRVGDTLGSLTGKLMLRFCEDTAIRAVIDDPDSLY